MTKDPFDRLRDANPLPEDRLPSAPMHVADRIAAGSVARAPLPGWAIAAAAAVFVAVLGSAWLLLVRDDGTDTFASAPPSGPTTAASVTTGAFEVEATTIPSMTTTAPLESDSTATTIPWTVGYDGEFPIFLFLDDNGTENAPGPYLIPTMRTTAILSAPITNIYATVAAFLMSGPMPGETEAVPAMSTAIPAGTEVLDVTVVDGVATIDLSEEFVSGGGSFSMTGRLAQVVFTLTAFEEIDMVRFEIEGVPTTVFGGEGVTVGVSADRSEFAQLVPPVMIEDPPHWGRAGNPLVASGSANVFEATVSLALTDNDGLILWEGFTTATCGTGCRGDWEVTIPYDVDEPQMGALIAWEASARDGSQTNVREHPVWLEPSDSTTATTSTSVVVDPDTELWQKMQDLRSEVRDLEEQRSGVAEALAVSTDSETIRDLEARLADVERLLFQVVRPQLAATVDRARTTGWSWDLILDETCSGAIADDSLPDQGLEDNRPVIEMWDDLHHAAVTCDWEALRDLAGDGVHYTFGEGDDPIGFWQYEEAIGYEPMRHLAEILRRPHAIVDWDYQNLQYVWPSAFPVEWSEVSEADREALRPLYGPADFAAFEEFGGYFGYRVGIDATTGEWLFFIQGD